MNHALGPEVVILKKKTETFINLYFIVVSF